jgi:hypothetical protein
MRLAEAPCLNEISVLCCVVLVTSDSNREYNTLYIPDKLRVFENRVLRRIFGPKRDEVMTEWRKLHNEKLRNLYSSPSIIRIVKSRRMRLARHVEYMGDKRNACRILV